LNGQKRRLWIKVLKETPLHVRRRASAYLESIKQTSTNEWVIQGGSGVQYYIRITGDKVTCTCPYYILEKGYCKHICAVAASELVKVDVLPWLKKLEKL